MGAAAAFQRRCDSEDPSTFARVGAGSRLCREGFRGLEFMDGWPGLVDLVWVAVCQGLLRIAQMYARSAQHLMSSQPEV